MNDFIYRKDLVHERDFFKPQIGKTGCMQPAASSYSLIYQSNSKLFTIINKYILFAATLLVHLTNKVVSE